MSPGLFFPFAYKVCEEELSKGIVHRRKSGIRLVEKLSGIKYFKDLTPGVIISLNNKLLKEGFKQNYINSLHCSLRICIKSAIVSGKIRNNPYDVLRAKRITLKRIATEKKFRYISQDDVVNIFVATYKTELVAYAAALFMFCCCTGLGYKDLVNLKYENIKEIGGKLWIVGNRVKTKQQFMIPLFDLPAEIIERYRSIVIINNRLQRRSPEHIFPYISYCYYNTLLKEVAKGAGINVCLSTHQGRHTFATLMSEDGVTISSIAEMLGHRSIDTSQIYTGITMQKILNETMRSGNWKLYSPGKIPKIIKN